MNHLQLESSPYLLQHAENPVDWYAWKPEALERALTEDKPILISIGYSSCHWCHVMEQESFEDPDIAAYMNTHFINIKVDREERPDLDQIYMEACQAITGGGGWPLNCFLMPDGRPFLAGTYYPPEPKYNRPSWIQLLRQVVKVFREERAKVEDQANRLSDLIGRSNKVFLSDQLETPKGISNFPDSLPAELFEQLATNLDQDDGGFGSVPKFPSTMSLAFLLEYAILHGEEKAMDHVHLSLEKMIRGGIYDQLGGGFARYATDKAWLIPHFEKMLYDNALLLGLLADAFRHSQKELYKTTMQEMLEFIQRELMHPLGGFYAALDADSEGEEGKFYVWSYEEIHSLLGEEAPLFCAFYGITEQGNWEGKNILWQPFSIADFERQHRIEATDFLAQLERSRQQLLQARNQRVRPGLDNKIILSWNALMISALVKAFHATGMEAFADLARKNIDFLEANFAMDPKGGYAHVATIGKEGVKVQYPAFLNDYAFLIEAFLHFYSLDFDARWIRKAADLSEYVWDEFLEEDSNLLYFTKKGQKDIPIRKVEILDNAIPSGNACMAQNWIALAVLTGKEEYRLRAEKMLLKVEKGLRKYPGSFAKWAKALLSLVNPIKEVAVVGENAKEKARKLQQSDISNFVLMMSETVNNQFPLLANKPTKKDAQIFICQNFTCDRPVLEVEAAYTRLKKGKK